MRRKLTLLLLIAVSTGLLSCNAKPPPGLDQQLDTAASRYVSLVLAFTNLFPDQLDFYSGPADLEAWSHDDVSLESLQLELDRASDELSSDRELGTTPRGRKLLAAYHEVQQLLEYASAPQLVSLPEQIKRLYGLEWSEPDAAMLDQVYQAIDDLLPGTGSLLQRMATWLDTQVIPESARQLVLERAVQECRARSLQHWPQLETSHLEFAWQGSQAAWHRYLGNGYSIVEVNPRALSNVSAVMDLACHEGYPGHHAQYVMLEDRYGGQVPIEDQVVLLRSLEAVKREAAAMVSVDLVFTPEERLNFEREVLYPLAGLNAEDASDNLALHLLRQELGVSIVPVVSDFLQDKLSFSTAVMQLQRQALVSEPAGLLQFGQQFGPYLAGYTLLAQQLALQLAVLKADTEGGSPEAADPRWQVVEHFLFDDQTRPGE